MTETQQASPLVGLCGHTLLYSPPPYIGDVVYCRSCRDFTTVKGGGMQRKYDVINCLDCAFERSYGNKTQNALRVIADMHSIRFRHAVEVINSGGRVCYRIES